MRYLILISYFLHFTTIIYAQVSQLSDEFNDATTLTNWLDINEVEGWNAQQLATKDINTSSTGNLVMIPHTSSWFRDLKGSLVHKNVTGDFILTTEVRATNRAETSYPGGQYSLAGLMIRTPIDYPNGALNDWQLGQQNYIFHALGFGSFSHPTCNGCAAPHFEIKTTVNSNSDLQVSTAPSNHLQIRMARIGDAVFLLYAPIGEEFIIRNRYCRTDFPETMQVGFVTYCDWDKVVEYFNGEEFFHNSNVLEAGVPNDPNAGSSQPFNPDLRAEFNFARFEAVEIPNDFSGTDFCDENDVTDEEILSLLSYPTAAPLAISDWNFSIQNKQDKVLLRWQNSAARSQQFTVEHRTQSTDFQTITTINASSNQAIEFTHTTPDDGINFYRIGVLTSGKKIQYTDIKSVILSANSTLMLYPNPTNGKLIVETKSSFVNGQVELFDTASQPLFSDNIYQPVFELEMAHLPTGMYWLKMTSPQGKTAYEKILKIR